MTFVETEHDFLMCRLSLRRACQVAGWGLLLAIVALPLVPDCALITCPLLPGREAAALSAESS
jgi:hypothetical protein